MRPLKMTNSGPPVQARSWKMLTSHLLRCSSLLMVLLCFASQITRSASAPTVTLHQSQVSTGRGLDQWELTCPSAGRC